MHTLHETRISLFYIPKQDDLHPQPLHRGTPLGSGASVVFGMITVCCLQYLHFDKNSRVSMTCLHL